MATSENKMSPTEALSPNLKKWKPAENEDKEFENCLSEFITNTKDKESEEHNKNIVRDFWHCTEGRKGEKH